LVPPSSMRPSSHGHRKADPSQWQFRMAKLSRYPIFLRVILGQSCRITRTKTRSGRILNRVQCPPIDWEWKDSQLVESCRRMQMSSSNLNRFILPGTALSLSSALCLAAGQINTRPFPAGSSLIKQSSTQDRQRAANPASSVQLRVRDTLLKEFCL